MADTTQSLQIEYDNRGCALKIGRRFAPCRGFTLSAYNGELFFHINDSSKCYDQQGKYDKTMLKSISMKWEYAVALKEAISEASHYTNQMLQVRNFFFY